MTGTTKSLFYLPLLYLWTGAKGNMLTALAPPVHLTGDRLGWTLLVCVVSDLRRGHLEVTWRMPSGHYISQSPVTSVVVNSKHRSHSPVSIITVATNDWPGYRCAASHKKRPKMTKKHHIKHLVYCTARSGSGKEYYSGPLTGTWGAPEIQTNKLKLCNEETKVFDDVETDCAVWTDTVVLLTLRQLLVKILVFNTLLTMNSVIKW